MNNAVPFNPQSLFVAVTTPFYENGDIHYDALIDHLIFLQDSEVPGIFLAGTTGEFSALTFEERISLLAVARETFEGQIVFNVSSPSLRESLEYCAIAQEERVDAVTALPPFYTSNAPVAGVVNFLKIIKESCDLPFILYQFPRHTGNDLTPEMVAEIGAVAVKDSAKTIERTTQYPNYLCGGDSSMVELMGKGAKGVVSVQGNYRPSKVVELFTAIIAQGDALELQEDIATVSATFRTENQIAAIKKAVSLVVSGYPTTVRLPLVPLGTSEEKSVTATVEIF